MSFLKKKHSYVYHDGGFLLQRCLHCEHKIGLDSWQIAEMPLEMAECEKGVSMGIIEQLFGSVNCLATKKQREENETRNKTI